MTDYDPEPETLEVLDFETPDLEERPREQVTTPVNLVGHDYTAHMPKQASLFFASAAAADSATEADQARALLQLVHTVFTDPVDQKAIIDRWTDRDDPLTVGAMLDMMQRLIAQWKEGSKVPAHAPVRVEAVPDQLPPRDPVRVRKPEYGLDLVCHQPKDIIWYIAASAIATRSNSEQTAWCLMLFLDASLGPAECRLLERRLNDPRDDLDLPHLLALTNQLMNHWQPDRAPQPNRKERRAKAASQRKSSGRNSKGAAHTRVKSKSDGSISEDTDG